MQRRSKVISRQPQIDVCTVIIHNSQRRKNQKQFSQSEEPNLIATNPFTSTMTDVADVAKPWCVTDGKDTFPCSATVMQGVSLPIAAAGLGLLMTVFLTKKVSL
jgi:hypothetical protein